MDTIVDAFFPIINYIESESDEIAEFLTDPLATPEERRMKQESLDIKSEKNITGIGAQRDKLDQLELHSTRTDLCLRALPLFRLPTFIASRLPKSFLSPTKKTSRSTMWLGDRSHHTPPRRSSTSFLPEVVNFFDIPTGDRGALLRRITESRKLVTGLSRLLQPKLDAVRGLRKRFQDAHSGLSTSSGHRHDITIYLGDLYGELL
jgi:Mg2+ and Co2+ transporter CorA